ncbi:hypothetical protein I4F81_012099 [Pyropia yezoensis]|uniref:Uncharacterized protein n=1 Tax=Pyropia yezoensis TaxID=2788 RepID=A0ACC3CII7_PYRYE|nr:hypothetical protein I4F81_012099 [Neopyropia yezoensis]
MSTPLDGYSDDDSDLDAASLRVLFRDTTPVGVAPAPAAGIPYSPAFVTVLGIVRAAAAADEASPRALLATAAALVRHNAADYSELKFTFRVGLSAEKNYQVWHHRRLIAAKASTAAVEADYAAAFHAADSKNYHAWAHRQWAAAHWAVDPAGEVAYAAALLSDDVKDNRSAWAYLLWWARLADAPTRVAVVADVAALVAEAPAARLPPVMLGRLRSLE